ncbi:MAG: thioredoxin domain-containing protein [Chitinophagales bacterium]
MNEPEYTNHLIHETSPYLLQHAHNPVNWFAWNDEAWKKARDENKLVIVSIGYSSCHWCHVMEHESFEDTAVAKVMNENFICIKVDREERPDVDQIYMTAVQLMTGSGGWPLNCVTLPDKRPIYGGTYFPKKNWVNLLEQLAEYYSKNEKDANDYAAKLTEGIHQAEVVKLNYNEAAFKKEDLEKAVANWKKTFDSREGGPNRAPKFPMPNNYEFLLSYAHAANDREALDHVLLTLNKMAYGGICDQLGGGFARYSTDLFWKAPHFEKMLYDNAQLVSLYSMAYRNSHNDLFRQIVFETCEFIKREMTSPDGGFYSALDADSEGKEGKFYVWKKEELQQLLGNRFDLFADYFNVNKEGEWEEGNYILLRKESDEKVADRFSMSVDALKKEIAGDKSLLLAERNKRVRPGLDDKQLTSWNALMIKGYCEAYNAFGEKSFLDAALKNGERNWSLLWRNDAGYLHSYKAGKASVNGFLEDYAFSAAAFIAIYQCTFDAKWLDRAKQVTDHAIGHFYDAQSGMFFFTSDKDHDLIARKMEIADNVIPSSNSCMARVLFDLALYFDEALFSKKAEQMLNNVQHDLKQYPSSYSNWAMLMLRYTYPFNEVVITGYDAHSLRKEFAQHFFPNILLAGGIAPVQPMALEKDHTPAIGLLEDRFVDGKNLIYICENKACKLPVSTVEEALKLLQ